MRRLAAPLLCLLAAGVAAAPAPKPRPWVDGWDRPVDWSGDCRFARAGDKLTIAVPGKGPGLDVQHGRLHAPHLLRDVKGDFVAQVRVRGDFKPAGEEGYHRAGLLITDGNLFVRV